eukprot:348403-Pyramimonas_sp.AAC.1
MVRPGQSGTMGNRRGAASSGWANEPCDAERAMPYPLCSAPRRNFREGRGQAWDVRCSRETCATRI